jgi:hypothetical protein
MSHKSIIYLLLAIISNISNGNPVNSKTTGKFLRNYFKSFFH